MPKMFKAPFYTEDQIREMAEENMQFPFSNIYMKYDETKRQYMPTEELLLKHGVNVSDFLLSTGENTPTNINNELEYISDQIYTYINKNSGSSMDTLKCIIAKGIRRGMSPYRFWLAFSEILWKQARFYFSNDDPTKSMGIDIEQKQWLNKGVLYNEDRNIDPQVKTMLMDLGLVWAGSYDAQLSGIVARQDW